MPALLALEVTEHRAQRDKCFECEATTTAPFPVKANARVGYGPRIKALMVYLMEYQLLPYERASELLEKNREGTLSPRERAEIDEICAWNRLFALIKAQARLHLQGAR